MIENDAIMILNTRRESSNMWNNGLLSWHLMSTKLQSFKVYNKLLY